MFRALDGVRVEGVEVYDPETGEGEDTAMGLPHPKHNPNCEIEKNPTFSLRIRRPCDVRLVLTQKDG